MKFYNLIEKNSILFMDKNQTQMCAFCNKQKSDVNILITGNTGNICDRCVSQANNIVQEEQ